MDQSIGIIGYGVVGKATAEVLWRLGYAVHIRDASPAAQARAVADGLHVLEEHTALDALFLCVPETVIDEAMASAPECALTVVRSSVPPGTTDALSEQYKRNLVHMPEFLREATATWDALNPQFMIIGAREEAAGQAVAKIFEPMRVPMAIVAPSTSEMVKLTMNTYFHTLISFWNEIHLMCELVGVESHIVGRLAAQDPRISPYGAHMHGDPAGGRCLPKDIAQMIGFAESVSYEPELLRAVQHMNERLESNKAPSGADSSVSEPETLAQASSLANSFQPTPSTL